MGRGKPADGEAERGQERGFLRRALMIATGSADGTVILWDWNTQQPIRTMNLNETVGDITGGQAIGVGWLRFSPDGAVLAGAGDLGSGILILWNTDDGSVQRTLTAMGHIAGPVATPLLAPEDWSYVYWWSRGSVIQVDTTTDQEGLRFSYEDFVVSASFSTGRPHPSDSLSRYSQ